MAMKELSTNKLLYITIASIVAVVIGFAIYRSFQPQSLRAGLDIAVSPTAVPTDEPHVEYEEPAVQIPEQIISIQTDAYEPKELRIRVKERIVFKNTSTTVQNATALNTGLFFFDTKDMQPGEERLIGTYNEPGRYEYYNRYNPEMRGAIIVEK